jgi:pyroglutamyl-peptidase
MRLLLSGFEPFGGEQINPSALVTQRILVEGIELRRIILPTEYGRSAETIISEINLFHPDWIIMLGQAAGRAQITPERVALNLDDASIPDNAGSQPREQSIASGPDALFSTLPIQQMVTAMHSAGVPASISNSAGTFVCNHVFYSVMLHISNNQLKARAGFIHIPLLPSQALEKSLPSMDLALICKGLQEAIREMGQSQV